MLGEDFVRVTHCSRPVHLLTVFRSYLWIFVCFLISYCAVGFQPVDAGEGHLLESKIAVAAGSSSPVSAVPSNVNKITVSPVAFMGVCAVAVDDLTKERASLGFVGSSDAEFLESLRRCLAVESANRRAFIVDKSYCLAGCEDITASVRDLLKGGRNQGSEAPIWNACAEFAMPVVARSIPESQQALKLVSELQDRISAKVSESTRRYEQVKATGASDFELAALKERLQGEINSFAEQSNREVASWEQALSDKLTYAASMFASTNRLNYLLNSAQVYTKGFDVTAPMSTYISGLKGKTSQPLEGPNPYRIGVFTSAGTHDQAALESACETVRKQKQLRAIVQSTAVVCGGTDVTRDVLNLLNGK